jgi:subtilisin family serine protease
MTAELQDRYVRPQRSIFLVAATTFALTFTTLGIAPAGANTSGAPPVLSGTQTSQLVVTYKPGVAPIDSQGNPVGESLLDGIDLKIMKSLGNNTFSIKLEESYDANQIAEITKSLEESSQIELAAPDLPISISARVAPTNFFPTSRTTQNLTEAGHWGLDRIDQESLPLNSKYIFDSTGKGVDAYIVDTGIYANSDFSGRLKPGYSAIADGYGTSDCTGHGTHVAGILGGSTHGVAKEVNLIPVRVLDCNGSGTSSTVIAGINWIIEHHQPDVPAVVNMSLGGDNDPALSAAVTDLLNDGVTVVVASGNGGEDRIGDDACNQTPANTFGTITVNSMNRDDSDSIFSNWGECTDIYAPGSNIISSWNTGPTSIASSSGTSMASPFVAGAVARILHENPEFTRNQVVSKLFSNSKPYNSGIPGDAPRMLHVPTVDDATLAANSASEESRLAAAEAARVEAARVAAAEAARVAAEQAAAAEAARVAAEQAAAAEAARVAAEQAAAAEAARVAASVPVVRKSLQVKTLKKKRLSVSIAAPAGSTTVIQRKVGKKWKTVTVRQKVGKKWKKVRVAKTLPSSTIRAPRAGIYRVQITIPSGKITTKSYRVR